MTRALGIDISQWQNDPQTPKFMDFAKARAAGADFIFIKASQANWRDRDFAHNWTAAKEAGLIRGAYHFLTWNMDGAAQADFMWSLIKDDPGELPPVVDYEWWGTVPSNAEDYLRKFVARIRSLSGRRPTIYTSAYFWNGANEAQELTSTCNLWVASWREGGEPRLPNGFKQWQFWQWTDKGDGLKYGAESLGLDMDWFYGDRAELRRWAGLPPEDEQPPEPPVLTIEQRLTALEARVAALEK